MFKTGFPGTINKPLVVDGLSIYYYNGDGDIYRHQVTDLVANNMKIEPPYDRLFNMSWLTDPKIGNGNYGPIPT